jgi:hypothetical protein
MFPILFFELCSSVNVWDTAALKLKLNSAALYVLRTGTNTVHNVGAYSAAFRVLKSRRIHPDDHTSPCRACHRHFPTQLLVRNLEKEHETPNREKLGSYQDLLKKIPARILPHNNRSSLRKEFSAAATRYNHNQPTTTVMAYLLRESNDTTTTTASATATDNDGRSDDDVYFGDESHPGTKKWRKAVRFVAKKNDEPYSPDIYRLIKKRLSECMNVD